MQNSFDQQILQDEMLETLVGAATDDFSRMEWLKHIADQIHSIDPDGPSFPTGSIGMGDLFDFAVAVGKWRSEHPGAKVDPLTPTA